MRLTDGETTYLAHIVYGRLADGTRTVEARVHAGACERRPENADAEGNAPCTAGAAFGLAICHPRDQFVRATGRKVALGRALRDLEPDKAARARIWESVLSPQSLAHDAPGRS